MTVEIKVPVMGESVTEGTVSRWLKAVGDTVEADEPLLEVSTDKVDTEVPSPASGTLLEIKVPEDEDAEVGAVLAIIGDPSEAGSAPAPAVPAPQAAQNPWLACHCSSALAVAASSASRAVSRAHAAEPNTAAMSNMTSGLPNRLAI